MGIVQNVIFILYVIILAELLEEKIYTLMHRLNIYMLGFIDRLLVIIINKLAQTYRKMKAGLIKFDKVVSKKIRKSLIDYTKAFYGHNTGVGKFV
jgi:hypothetical protein